MIEEIIGEVKGEMKNIHLRQDSFEQRLFSLELVLKEIKRNQEEMKTILLPISQTYEAAGTLRKWINSILIGITVIAGAMFSLREIYQMFKK